jgi:hypothetical protein
MRRLLLLVALITSLVGCNNPKGTEERVWIYITSDKEAWVSGAGGNHCVECKTHGGEGLQLQATSNDEWLTVERCGSSMVWYQSSKNDSGEVRYGSITIIYGEESCTLVVVQRPYADKEFEAKTLQGSSYYGDEATSGELYNYHMVLSQNGIDESGFLYSDSEYFFLDLYSQQKAYDSDAWYLPTGLYTTENGGINLEDSYYTKTDDSSATELGIVEASVSVDIHRIEARLTLEDNTTVNLYYKGLTLVHDREDSLSTLNQHLRLEIPAATYIGTISEDNHCLIYIFEKFDYTTGIYSGEMFQLSLLLPDDATDIVGVYREGNTPGSFIVGCATEDEDGNMELQESWYMKADLTERAPLMDGVITIEKQDTGGYVFSLDVMDGAKHNISASIRATGQMV